MRSPSSSGAGATRPRFAPLSVLTHIARARIARAHLAHARIALAIAMLAGLALPSTALAQSWLERVRKAEPELVVYGRVKQSHAYASVDELLGRTGFADQVFAPYYNGCGLLCGGMGGPSGFKWYQYPRHVDQPGWSARVLTLSAQLRPHLRVTALLAGEATLGGVIGGSCPNQVCTEDFGYGPRYHIGIDPHVSSLALLAEGEFGPLRLGIGPARHGVTIQSMPYIDVNRQWKERFTPLGGVASVGLTLPLWRGSLVSGRWVYAAMGDVQLSARDVSNDMAPPASPTRRFDGGKVNLSNSYVLLGVGLRVR